MYGLYQGQSDLKFKVIWSSMWFKGQCDLEVSDLKFKVIWRSRWYERQGDMNVSDLKVKVNFLKVKVIWRSMSVVQW